MLAAVLAILFLLCFAAPVKGEDAVKLSTDGSRAMFTFSDPSGWDAVFGDISIRDLQRVCMAAAAKADSIEKQFMDYKTATDARVLQLESELALFRQQQNVCE